MDFPRHAEFGGFLVFHSRGCPERLPIYGRNPCRVWKSPTQSLLPCNRSSTQSVGPQTLIDAAIAQMLKARLDMSRARCKAPLGHRTYPAPPL